MDRGRPRRAPPERQQLNETNKIRESSTTMVSLRKPTAIIVTAWPTFTTPLLRLQYVAAFSAPPTLFVNHDVRHQGRVKHSILSTTALHLSSSDIQAKLMAQMAKLQERDRSSREISTTVSRHESKCRCMILFSFSSGLISYKFCYRPTDLSLLRITISWIFLPCSGLGCCI